MRCKTHLADLSSSAGVCASCLRERLLSLIAAQAQAQALAQAQAQRTQTPAQEESRKSDPHPPPLIFPRSVSPYINPRESNITADWSSQHRHRFDHRPISDQRFFSTPQVGPTAGDKKKKSRFHVIWKLFRSRSHKLDGSVWDPDAGVSRQSCQAEALSSWTSSFMHRSRRKKASSLFSLDEASCSVGRKHCRRDRGLSPNVAEDGWDGLPSPKEYSRQTTTAVAKPSYCRVKPSPGRSNVAGLAFCLSPLVGAGGPNRHWSSPEVGYPGEIKIPAKPHLSTAASFRANRSRKLADFGRMNLNR
ncbi:hypothetical protein Nepgr_002501 [Nepenthes gracilis]|uniref:Uncharacterized protein n=1 Tax=Nepenthes gracilis TaxID=150966 RepID=A0AAD3RWY2_NEPGR|nr:hypothetical protein Nepgr_002501 [Nepenthes gracilis]